MITCQACRDLIEKYLDVTISDAQVEELKAHTEGCESCREELERYSVMPDVVKEAFSFPTAVGRIKASLAARRAGEPNLQVQRIHRNRMRFAWALRAVAAVILLVAGLSLGFALGRAGFVRPTGVPTAMEVPMRIANIEGTVLAKHEGCEVWQVLEAGSKLYLGDTFHSAAKSAFVLELEDESTLELNENSMLVLKLYNGGTEFHLEHGQLAAALNSPHPPFFVSTPHGRVEALGTEFTVTVE
jgi:predicted anti-sigma-YlaC factor YlaD